MEVGGKEAVVLGKLAVNLGSEVILGSDLLRGKTEDAYVSTAQVVSVRHGIESIEKGGHARTHMHWPRRKQPLARGYGRHGIHVSHAERLPQPLVVGKKESPILLDWPSDRSPELIPLEGRNLGVEKISRVDRTIAQKFISITVKGIGPGSRHRVDHTA